MPKLPVTIVTGFLGAGKTTLLTSLLASEREQRFAIVVNEFGAVSVDDVLLHAHGSSTTRIFKVVQSLIAYAGDEFLATMGAISAQAPLFDQVLIETSGLAVPTAVMAALQQPPLQEHFLHDATLTIVDTPLLLAGQYDQPATASAGATVDVFQQQLQCADVVVLNKIDQCDAADLLRAETAIRTRAPDIRFVELAWQARLDPRLVLGLHLHEFRAEVPRTGVSAAEAAHLHDVGHAHSGLGHHAHGLLTHEHLHAEDPGWLSFVLRSPTPQVPATLQQALTVVTTQAPVLRVKGFAHVRDGAGHLVVQGVRTRIECSLEPSAHGQAHAHDAMAELVFIGYHLSREQVTTVLCAQTGTVWT